MLSNDGAQRSVPKATVLAPEPRISLDLNDLTFLGNCFNNVATIAGNLIEDFSHRGPPHILITKLRIGTHQHLTISPSGYIG